MNLDEAMDEETTCTRAEAAYELRKHGHTISEFEVDFGRRDEYNTHDILIWLGY